MLFIVDVKDGTADFVAKLPVQRMQTGKIDVEATACTDTRHECSSVAQRMHERLRTGNNQGGCGSGDRFKLVSVGLQLEIETLGCLKEARQGFDPLTRPHDQSSNILDEITSQFSDAVDFNGFLFIGGVVVVRFHTRNDRVVSADSALTFWAVRLRAQRRPWLLGDDVGGGVIVRASGRVRQSRG